MTTVVSYTEIRNRLAATMDQVNQDHAPVIITRRNGQHAVLMSLDDFNAWQETLYLLRSPANAADLLQAATELRERPPLMPRELIEGRGGVGA